jgi:hypothetical protein
MGADWSAMKIFCILVFAAAAMAAQANTIPEPTAIDRAFNRMYNFDFPGAQAILDVHIKAHPDEPLAYSVRGAVYLFSEFHRLKILEMEFFADDNSITDKKRTKPDPAVRAILFQAAEKAKTLAKARLALDENNCDALMAYCLASAVETDYTGLVDKKYFRAYSLSKETQQYARKLLALNPPAYDGYLTLGAVEYVTANLNFFFRLFIRFNGIDGSRQKSIEDLKRVVEGGRYLSPYAKILMAVVYLRENQPQKSLALMKEMERDFPENPLIPAEIARIEKKIKKQERR